MIHIPDVVRSKAVVAGASAWLEDLPAWIADVAAAWGLSIGRALDGGTESFVAEVTLPDGEPAVLKMLIPRDGAAAQEITALRLADGRGCARLLRADETRGALLLERLGPSLFDLGVPIQRRHEILARAALQMWRPAPDCGLPTGAAKGRWLIDFVQAKWEQLDRPCSERAVAYAVTCAEQRVAAHREEQSVLVHGDVHQWNALRFGDGFKLIDPDGLFAEAEYDMGIVMREDPVELLHGDPWDRAHRLAGLTGLDPVAIWEWGAVERVSTGLLLTEIGLQPVGREMLTAADHIA